MHLSTLNPWTLYAGIITGLLLFYYIFVGWKYYRKQIRALLAGKTKKRGFDSREAFNQIQEPDSNQKNNELVEEQPPEWQNKDLPAMVENLFEYLTTEIEEAHQKGYNKQDMIQMLQMILKDYHELKMKTFRFAVNNRIDAECAKYGSIHLSERDKEEVWRMV